MGLQDLLNLSTSKSQQKIGLSEERIAAVIPQARQYISFWREYPDRFVDFMQTGGREDVQLTFHLFFYQRVFLRVAMRYKYVYCVFPRRDMCGVLIEISRKKNLLNCWETVIMTTISS